MFVGILFLIFAYFCWQFGFLMGREYELKEFRRLRLTPTTELLDLYDKLLANEVSATQFSEKIIETRDLVKDSLTS